MLTCKTIQILNKKSKIKLPETFCLMPETVLCSKNWGCGGGGECSVYIYSSGAHGLLQIELYLINHIKIQFSFTTRHFCNGV